MPTQKQCPVCNAPIPASTKKGRPRVTCSDTCAMKRFRAQTTRFPLSAETLLALQTLKEATKARTMDEVISGLLERDITRRAQESSIPSTISPESAQ